MLFLTEDILNSAKVRTFAPISQTTFSDADLILIANEELQLKLVSDIQSIREDFFLGSTTQSLVANIGAYYIPSRAIGNALRAVTYVDSQGSESSPLNRISIDRAYLFAGTNTVPSAYYIQSDQIVLLPTPSISAGSIRQYFAQRPNQLVATASCAKITAIATVSGTTTFTVNTDLTATLAVGGTVDILRAKSPFMLTALDVPVTVISASTIAVSQSLVSDVNLGMLPAVGDYICLAGQANIAQVPQEFHPMLAQMVAIRILESLGDMNKRGAAEQTLNALRKEALKLIKNRVESAPQKVDTRGGILGRIGSRYGFR
jgi:hypothetical protein